MLRKLTSITLAFVISAAGPTSWAVTFKSDPVVTYQPVSCSTLLDGAKPVTSYDLWGGKIETAMAAITNQTGIGPYGFPVNQDRAISAHYQFENSAYLLDLGKKNTGEKISETQMRLNELTRTTFLDDKNTLFFLSETRGQQAVLNKLLEQKKLLGELQTSVQASLNSVLPDRRPSNYFISGISLMVTGIIGLGASLIYSAFSSPDYSTYMAVAGTFIAVLGSELFKIIKVENPLRQLGWVPLNFGPKDKLFDPNLIRALQTIEGYTARGVNTPVAYAATTEIIEEQLAASNSCATSSDELRSGFTLVSCFLHKMNWLDYGMEKKPVGKTELDVIYYVDAITAEPVLLNIVRFHAK